MTPAELWDLYRSIDPHAPSEMPQAVRFCDNRQDADTCAALVREGRKRATATSLAEIEASGEAVPAPGDHAIVTDWDGYAVCVIRTRSVEIVRFRNVTEEFAREEGEGDLTLAWWRRAHEAYHRRVLAGTKYRFSEDLEIACERFETVFRP